LNVQGNDEVIQSVSFNNSDKNRGGGGYLKKVVEYGEGRLKG